MFEIKKPIKKTYYAAHGPDALHIGVTDPGLVTVSGQPNFEQDVDPEAFAGKVEGAGLTKRLPPLPAKGEEVEKDRLYNYNGRAIVALETKVRGPDEPGRPDFAGPKE